MRKENGYLTVYLALCLTLILSLYLVLIDGARRSGAALEAVCAAETSLQSALAEYHRGLFEQYNLLAIDSSYGTEIGGKRRTEARLMNYLRENLNYGDVFLADYLYRDFFGLHADDAELTKVSILSDENGAVFRKQAVEAIREDVGLGVLEELQGWMQTVKVNGLDEADIENEKKLLEQRLEEYNGKEVQISETESVYLEVENPMAKLETEWQMGLLRLVLGDDEEISENVIDSSILIKSRMEQENVNLGNMAAESAADPAEQLLFQEYLMRYMGNYGRENKEGALRYQIEYLVAGKNSDPDNLESTAAEIGAVREAANALYLLTDQEKLEEIQLTAGVICGLLAVPELIPLMESIILLGWASAESVYDLKTLLAGGKVPLIKDRESWHYSLGAALTGNLESGTESGKGLDYEDYLRILMTLTDLETLTGRAMDMVEADIRLTPGNAAFRLDACYARVEAAIRISSSFGYQYEITRERGY